LYAAAIVGDLFVGEHGAERRTPVDRHLGHVCQAVAVEDLGAFDLVEAVEGAVRVELLGQFADRAGRVALGIEPRVVQLQEDPLRPPVVVRFDRCQLAGPVIAEAQRLELADHVADVALGRLARVHAVLDGELFCGQAEGIEAHRVQDVEPLHPLQPAVDVRRDVPQRMAHVQAHARRVREHVQAIQLRPCRVEAGVARVEHRERALLGPVLLPACLDGVRKLRVVPMRVLVVGRSRRLCRSCPGCLGHHTDWRLLASCSRCFFASPAR
jgi:hypothetical protein